MTEPTLEWIMYNEDGVKRKPCTSPICRDYGVIHTHELGPESMVLKNG
jgi:hypothetical protein